MGAPTAGWATSCSERSAHSRPGVTLHDRGARQCAIVTFTKHGEPPDDMAARLKRAGANVSVSRSAYARLDFGARGIDAVVRASVHYYNTLDEVEHFCRLVASASR
ncbi:aminotransferase class V-fold PLP-dependent enzyme [Mesorhizobium sp. AR07]|uniref:aminotransferase class V-fold PLP-dependent enzyme n=1 Tax=Mesorhizobium sp. AR07 TaxID=2865838 RepID=UPI00215DD7DF|nr:aminotransferase class V-fold PLP-dependent enzyme [Mesorhizobium sp. AR07]UVK43987.1 aminotransferase class V-fold PLP-dependent enzyme [Mesorhizobium sp. AR07]